MTAYALYNEIDDYAADWLENLIKADLIAPGIVDRRSIEDIRGDDLRGFRQVHFFAGIGVWSYALRCAGVSDDTPLWTGSCPCQPFSAAGKGTGMDDERHLWPAFFHLIRECRPHRVLGEQVASSDGLNWLDLVSIDLETEDYAIGPVDTCSAGHGAPHIRQRLRFYAYDLRRAAEMHGGGTLAFGAVGRMANGDGWNTGTEWQQHGGEHGQQPQDGGAVEWLDNNNNKGLEGLGSGHRAEIGQREGSIRSVAEAGELGGLADESESGRLARGRDCEPGNGRGSSRIEPGRLCDAGRVSCATGRLEHSSSGWERWQEAASRHHDDGQTSERQQDQHGSVVSMPSGVHQHRTGPTNGFWRDADWLFCRDERWRPVMPESFPLVDGSAFRMGSGSPFEGKSRQGMLKGYGNAIDAQATIDFIKVCLEYRPADRVASGSLEDLLV